MRGNKKVIGQSIFSKSSFSSSVQNQRISSTVKQILANHSIVAYFMFKVQRFYIVPKLGTSYEENRFP